ncbi:hypothetical protein HAALTHF_29430n [Vreelandella aquamarina]|nr:hypothetical protein HAALTHF_29430n [Halomonas axialensis]
MAKNELSFLNDLRLEASEHVDQLNSILVKTPVGARQDAKAKLNQAQLSIESFNKLLASERFGDDDVEYKALIEKFLQESHVQKENAEKSYQS